MKLHIFTRHWIFCIFQGVEFLFCILSKIPTVFFLKLIIYTLLLSGDIELNPGPDILQEIFTDKSVQGSFHQGNDKFLETAGVQCSSNCFFAVCYSQFIFFYQVRN